MNSNQQHKPLSHPKNGLLLDSQRFDRENRATLDMQSLIHRCLVWHLRLRITQRLFELVNVDKIFGIL